MAIAAPIVTLAGFLAGLAVTLISSEVLARGLTRLGSRLGLTEGLLGLLAALGADSPELSSAVIAIAAGSGSVGVGVVLGSNLFNLAALLGLSAIIAGGVAIRRGPLILDGAVGLLMIMAAGLMVAGVLSPAIAAVLAALVAIVYVLVLAAPRAVLRGPLERIVPADAVEVPYDPTPDRPATPAGSWPRLILMPFAALVGVVAGSYVMVQEALAARNWLHLSDAVLGLVVLAVLTSLPNLWVALHFARTARGTALFSSAMNSNTINLLGGLVVPALVFGASAARGSLTFFAWLVGLTLLAVLVPLPYSRLSRLAGAAIIVVYLLFVALRLSGV